MTCSSRTERNLRGSSYNSVDIVSSEPRDLTSEVMNQVQEMSLLPELVSRGFQDVKATGERILMVFIYCCLLQNRSD